MALSPSDFAATSTAAAFLTSELGQAFLARLAIIVVVALLKGTWPSSVWVRLAVPKQPLHCEIGYGLRPRHFKNFLPLDATHEVH